MNIRDRREIKAFAAGRLAHAGSIRQIVLIYAGLTLGLSALVTVVNYVLGLQMESLTGLRNLGTRNTLSTIQSLLPIAVSLLTMCIELGYQAVMLRIARGQYVSPQTLRLGLDRFWVLLRSSLFQGFRYMAILFLSVYFGIMIFMMTPLSDNAMEILAPAMAEMSLLDNQIVLEDAVYAQFAASIWPAYLICGGIFALAAVPVMYGYRMVNYVIIDKPALGALAALRESKQMMRGNRMELFKLDLSLWWYYLAVFGAQAVCYGDVILPMLGVQLPGNADVWYFVFLAAYLAVLFAVTWCLRSRVEVAYALAYDSVKPEEKQDNGVVLGNIFQM